MQKIRVLSVSLLTFLICILLIAGCNPSTPDRVDVSIEISESSYEPMNDFLRDFRVAFSESSRVALSKKPIDELFPAKEIPADELSWFLESREDITLKACKGIRFDNGDILIVFFYDAEGLDATVSECVAINISMYGSPLIPPPNVYEYSGSGGIGDGFGVITYSFSGSDMEQLVAEIARDTREH